MIHHNYLWASQPGHESAIVLKKTNSEVPKWFKQMASKLFIYLRKLAGVIINDWPRYQRLLGASDVCYLALCNRNETLIPAPDGSGYRCDWQWTSDLRAPRVLPFLGRWLMQRALADHPIQFASTPEHHSDSPDISFVIGHRGMNRLPQLKATLASIAGQSRVSMECLVVEQDVRQTVRGRLPEWVRYVYNPLPEPIKPFGRSLALNQGVARARGTVLVLHDNDMLVPHDYARCILETIQMGYDVVNLKRFIFYLSQSHSKSIFSDYKTQFNFSPESIMQNSEGGGSVAITREAYDEIGGMDESFVGWGGEDNEFWERANTQKVYPYGFLPLVHLWHEAQPEKQSVSEKGGAVLYHELSKLSPEFRIKKLRYRLSAGGQPKSNGACFEQLKGQPQ